MAGICTSPYPIEKVRDSPYPYSYTYPVNAGILRKKRGRIRTIPTGRVYLLSVVIILRS